jgi:pimeloyl-ACP methyl ester carboxylesterase
MPDSSVTETSSGRTGERPTTNGRPLMRARVANRLWDLVGVTPAAPHERHAAPVGDDYGSKGRSEWLDIDWRKHLRQAQVHRSRVNYVELGEGPPVVFIHGLAGCWQNWLENIPEFAKRYRAIAVDMPGFGQSELPRDEISISGYGRFVDAFLEQIGVERGVLIGNSMGGFIAAETAITHPSRVEKLVLVSAAGGPALRERNAPHANRLLRAARLFGPITAAAFARREHMIRRPRLRQILLWKVARHPDRLEPELCYEVASGAGKPGFLDALNSILEYDFSDRLPEVACPTLIVWGASDEIVPVADAREYEQLIPGARKVIFEDTGHVPMLERPARFNRLVEEFIAA